MSDQISEKKEMVFSEENLTRNQKDFNRSTLRIDQLNIDEKLITKSKHLSTEKENKNENVNCDIDICKKIMKETENSGVASPDKVNADVDSVDSNNDSLTINEAPKKLPTNALLLNQSKTWTSEEELTDASQDNSGIIKSESDDDGSKLKIQISTLLPLASRKNKRNVPRRSWDHLAKRSRSKNIYSKSYDYDLPGSSPSKAKVIASIPRLKTDSKAKPPKGGLRADCPTFCKSGCTKTHHKLLVHARRMIENDSTTTLLFLNRVSDFYDEECGGTMFPSDCIDDPWKNTSFPLLHYLALMGKCAGCFALVDAGHDPLTVFAKNGDTVLHTMIREMYNFNCTHGHMDILFKKFNLLLKEFKACMFITNLEKETCFHICGKLINATSKICSDRNMKKPPYRLYQFLKNMFTSCLEMIQESDYKNLNLQDTGGCTVGHYIAEDRASVELLTMLKIKGCDFSIKNAHGNDITQITDIAPSPPSGEILELAIESQKGKKYKIKNNERKKEKLSTMNSPKKRKLTEKENTSSSATSCKIIPAKAVRLKDETKPIANSDVKVPGKMTKVVEIKSNIPKQAVKPFSIKVEPTNEVHTSAVTNSLEICSSSGTVILSHSVESCGIKVTSGDTKKHTQPSTSSSAIPHAVATTSCTSTDTRPQASLKSLKLMSVSDSMKLNVTKITALPKSAEKVPQSTNLPPVESVCALNKVTSAPKHRNVKYTPFTNATTFGHSLEALPSMVSVSSNHGAINTQRHNKQQSLGENLQPLYPATTNVQGSNGKACRILPPPNFQQNIQRQSILKRPHMPPTTVNNTQQQPLYFKTPDGRLIPVNMFQPSLPPQHQMLSMDQQKMMQHYSMRNPAQQLPSHHTANHNTFASRAFPRGMNGPAHLQGETSYGNSMMLGYNHQQFFPQRNTVNPMHPNFNAVLPPQITVMNQLHYNSQVSPLRSPNYNGPLSPNYPSSSIMLGQSGKSTPVYSHLGSSLKSPPSQGLLLPSPTNTPILTPLVNTKKHRSLNATIKNLHHSAAKKRPEDSLRLGRVVDSERENAPPVIILDNDELEPVIFSKHGSSSFKQHEQSRVAPLVRQYLDEKGSVVDFLQFSNEKKMSLVEDLTSAKNKIYELNSEILFHENEVQVVRGKIVDTESELTKLRVKLTNMTDIVAELRSKRADVVDSCTELETRIKAVESRTEIFHTLTNDNKIGFDERKMDRRI